MAWKSIYKWFIPWRKTPYVNQIVAYKKHLYDTWFESLTNDQKLKETQRVQREKERNRIDLENLFYRLGSFPTLIDTATHGALSHYNEAQETMSSLTMNKSKYW